MPRRLRFSLANVLLTMTCIALAIGWWSTVKPPPILTIADGPPTDAAIAELPLTILAAAERGLGGRWYLSVNSAGDGQLTISELDDSVQSVKVSASQLKALRDLLIKEQFFTLQDDYGELVPDGGAQSLTISVGECSKTVRIHFLGNWVASNDVEKLREPARAVRVWMLIRGWVSDPKVWDSRPYDQRVLNVVNGTSKGAN